ncbi:MAG TPA: peptidylprolyl isomerase [Pirellulales bacterium]|jgi:cyclophilin family peptidyl-prolyl cis-trans isomerase|nr:peptidylprolyl isomerase [Pirellulales bacterium]
MFSRLLVAMLVFVVFCPAVMLADEPAKPAETRPAETKAAETKPAETKQESATKTAKGDKAAADKATAPDKTAAPAKSPAQEQFEKLLAEWTDVRNDMEDLQITYKETPPGERKPLVARFNELARKGTELEDRLVDAAAKAYRDTKGDDAQAADVLQSFAQHYFASDRFERVLAAARPVLDTKPANPRLYSIAGAAAYHTNDYDLAQKYLDEGEKEGALERHSKELLASIPAAKEKWAEEKKIRDEEAKADDLPRVELVTSRGPVVLELFENQAPQSVANFISLVDKKFYDGLAFHRVIPGFMAQGGDPKGDGTGGPGYRIPCECYRPDHRLHFRGSLSMAHAGKDSGGSQFFITFVRTPHLDGQHTVFGRVIEGMDAVSQLQRTEPGLNGEKTPPSDKILEARVLRKRDRAYEPTKLPE